MVKSIRSNTDMFGVSREQLQPFEKFLSSIEGRILSRTIFKVGIEHKYKYKRIRGCVCLCVWKGGGVKIFI